MDVGVRDLRNALSRHLARVREGETITVTEHGKPIAKIVPIKELSVLERLIAEGRVTPAKHPKGPLPPPIKANGTVSDLVRW